MSDSTNTTRREKIGMWIAVLSGPILAELYWQYQGTLSGLADIPPGAVALVSAAGCAVGGWICGRTPATRIAAMVSAALMGLGCTLAFQWMNGDLNVVTSGRRWLSIGLGILPGLILGVVWIILLEKRARPGANGRAVLPSVRTG